MMNFKIKPAIKSSPQKHAWVRKPEMRLGQLEKNSLLVLGEVAIDGVIGIGAHRGGCGEMEA